ncbi:hypothetical protein GOODEAATRI_021243 [Goodea atripinnis]|uniref:Uncharacterized protein n=1 Tax=Goodea atripinnis TaxID=208336 RepID=A0ABV0N378_9TELE
MCTMTQYLCSFKPPLVLTELHSVSKCINLLDVHYILGLSQYFGQFVFKDLCIAKFSLPLPPIPADCRFYHIWSFTAPCLTAFQDHFLMLCHWLLPALSVHF